MSHRPDTEVVFQFSQGAGGVTNFFTLDDPVKGVLDNTTYTLAGPFSVVDVTQYVREVSISRGRSRILDKVQTGQASIRLDNRARLFDPTAGTAISPYSNDIVPRKNVQITVASEPVFTGQVDDWNIEYDLNGDSTSTAVCVDGFAQLAGAIMGTATRTSELSSARVDAILTEIGWPTDKRNIQTGNVTLQADTPAVNTNALTYLQTVSDTEFGALFMNRAGNVEFDNRDTVQNFGSSVLLGGTGIPISALQVNVGSELLFNTITLTRNAGGTVTRSDATSVTAYGDLELNRTGYLFTTDSATGALADFLLARYKDSTLRVEQVTIVMGRLTAAQQQQVAQLDVNSPTQVTFAPKVGPVITQFTTVDRVEHRISPADHLVTLQLSEAQAAFILDSQQFGVLDQNVLGL